MVLGKEIMSGSMTTELAHRDKLDEYLKNGDLEVHATRTSFGPWSKQ